MLDIDHDLHIHTNLSRCCHDPKTHVPEAIVRTAEDMGLRTIGFADHVWVNPDEEPNGFYRPQDESQIIRLRAALSDVRTDLRMLVGCEAETIAPGRYGITRAFAESLDFVLLACSHFHIRDLVAQPERDDVRGLADHLLLFFKAAVTSGLATAIPHPLLPFGSEDRYDAAIATLSDGELENAFGEAQRAGVGVEITTSFFPSTKGKKTWSLETPLRCLEVAKRVGCTFTFASDAHDLDMLRTLPQLRHFVDELGLTSDDLHPLVKPYP